MRQMRWIVGDADELRSGDFSRGLGATTETKCSHKNWKNEKRKPFKLCLVKRKIQISYKLEYDNFML